jgi:hypothetical protein
MLHKRTGKSNKLLKNYLSNMDLSWGPLLYSEVFWEKFKKHTSAVFCLSHDTNLNESILSSNHPKFNSEIQDPKFGRDVANVTRPTGAMTRWRYADRSDDVVRHSTICTMSLRFNDVYEIGFNDVQPITKLSRVLVWFFATLLSQMWFWDGFSQNLDWSYKYKSYIGIRWKSYIDKFPLYDF